MVEREEISNTHQTFTSIWAYQLKLSNGSIKNARPELETERRWKSLSITCTLPTQLTLQEYQQAAAGS